MLSIKKCLVWLLGKGMLLSSLFHLFNLNCIFTFQMISTFWKIANCFKIICGSLHSIPPLKLYYETIGKFKTESLSSQKVQSLVSLSPLKNEPQENKN